MLKRLRAKYYKIPFKINGYWPAYRRYKSDEGYMEFEPLFFNTRREVGDIVDVLHDYNLTVHSYLITEKYRAPGSDHVMNPLQFDLKYHSTRKIKKEEYKVEDIDDMFEPRLLRIK